MKYSPYIFRGATFCAVVVFFAYSGCSSNSTNSVSSSAYSTPSEKVAVFVNNSATASATWMRTLDGVATPAGTRDSTSAWEDWRISRQYYEQIRFAFDGCDPSLGYQFASWLSDKESHSEGFHYIERCLWARPIQWDSGWSRMRALWYNNGITTIMLSVGSGPPDGKIFNGLLGMLADIDTLKFTRLDSSLSRNAVSDVFQNFAGLDTVINYYLPPGNVPDSLKHVDSVFTNAYQNAYNAWLTQSQVFYTSQFNAGQFNTQYLIPLESAIIAIAVKLKYFS